MRLSECAGQPRGADTASALGAAFHHYGAAGGAKPDGSLRRWQWLERHALCERGRLVPYFAENAEVLVRTLSWLRRTQALVAHELVALAGREGADELRSRATLATCAASLDTGLSCVAAHAAALANDSIQANIDGCVPHVTAPRCDVRTLRASELLALRPGRSTLPRPTSLLAPAVDIRGSYTTASRWDRAWNKEGGAVGHITHGQSRGQGAAGAGPTTRPDRGALGRRSAYGRPTPPLALA